jgi:hypothetical protein
MAKQELLDKTKENIAKTTESISTLETENLLQFIQTATIQSLLDNPLVLLALILVLFYALFMRSKFMLLFLFGLLSLMFLIRYTLPSGEHALTAQSTIPFAFGCLGIGAIILYFMFIKSE